MLNPTEINKNSDEVFYGITTKYQLNPLSLFGLIHFSAYFSYHIGFFQFTVFSINIIALSSGDIEYTDCTSAEE